MIQKPGTPSSMPSKTIIFSWIKQILPEASPKMKVEDLGDGVVYCKIINHYFPGTINPNRLNLNPKNQYDYSLNLKLFQNALALHKITAPFDVAKIAKLKFLQNWGLINALYRQLSPNNQENTPADDAKSHIPNKFTPKRSFEAAFPNQQNLKLPDHLNFSKPTYNPPIPQPTQHYQNPQLYSTQPNVNPHPQQPLQDQNRMTSSMNNMYAQNQPSNQGQVNQINSTANQSYNPQNITQTAFGGFSFSMSNPVVPMNLLPNNQNLNFMRRDSIPQVNKTLQFDQPTTNKCWSVGKLPTRESMGLFSMPLQQNSGKYSVNSHIFQNNYNAVIDRVKQILLKNSHDIEKIRQIKILLNIPLNEDMIKIEEEENVMHFSNSNKITQNSGLKEKEIKHSENIVQVKDSIVKLKEEALKDALKECVEIPESKSSNSSKSLSNVDPKDKENQDSKPISNSGSSQEMRPSDRSSLFSRLQQSSGKKIKNNFFGEGAVFRK